MWHRIESDADELSTSASSASFLSTSLCHEDASAIFNSNRSQIDVINSTSHENHKEFDDIHGMSHPTKMDDTNVSSGGELMSVAQLVPFVLDAVQAFATCLWEPPVQAIDEWSVDEMAVHVKTDRLVSLKDAQVNHRRKEDGGPLRRVAKVTNLVAMNMRWSRDCSRREHIHNIFQGDVGVSR
eukprot:TRINITY_DN68442_c0_g1_i1.p1 TRINITY_DN68442_c0_g1~~TRINITY_DN68442_c0_g1_i1.p1  ORF type:complete len:183 (+),score=24.84 TRINITY_DN68442_c0_g1_i1:74-622(+)